MVIAIVNGPTPPGTGVIADDLMLTVEDVVEHRIREVRARRQPA